MKNVMVAAILALCTGCMEDPNLQVNVAEDWEYKVKFPDSEVYYNEAGYEQQIPGLVQKAISNDSQIVYSFDDGNDTRSNSGGVSKSPLYVPSPLRGYGLVLSFEKHTLKGCINRNVYHANVDVRGGPSGAFWDLHIPVWVEAGRICTGVYITWNPPAGANWCRTTCSPTYTEVRGLVASALIAAGFTAMMAEVLASIATPAVFAGLAL